MTAGVATARDRSVMAVARAWMRDGRSCRCSCCSPPARRRPADRAAGHRDGGLGVQHAAVRDPACHHRRLPDADDAHRRNRSVRGRGRLDGGLRHGDDRLRRRLVGRLAHRPGAGRRRRAGERDRRRSLPRPPADHDDQHGPGGLRRGERLLAREHRRRDARSARDHVARRPDPVRLPAEQPPPVRARWPRSSSFGLRRSGYGRLLYAVGDNETAARLAGVRVSSVSSSCT